MVTLSPSTAVTLVRKNLEELDPNGSIMFIDENGSSADYGDNKALDTLIRMNLPEAINVMHKFAPVTLLEGENHEFAQTDTVALTADGILSLTMGDDARFLRLVAFQAADSRIVVTDVLGEASPEGRKQLNRYIRGRADRPRLVLLQGRHTGPAFKYYTMDTDGENFNSYMEDPASAVSQLIYIKEQFYDASVESYDISRRLRQNIIDWLTGMVLENYSDQRAQSFYQKANNFSNI